MSRGTSIEWTDDSWNPIRARNRATGRVGWHCEHVSEGCRNCYAEGFNARLGTQMPYKPGLRGGVDIFLDDTMLLAPLKWKKPRKIFVCSMTDLFAKFVSDEMLDAVFAVMALRGDHVFQVLTKRPERMREYVTAQVHGARHVTDHVDRWQTKGLIPKGVDPFRWWIGSPDRPRPLPNVWLGVSVEDQAAADERIPILLDTPAAVRWLSCEPLLGPVDLSEWLVCPNWSDDIPMDMTTGLRECCAKCDYTGIAGFSGLPIVDWVVAGGESGPGARPMHPDWARVLRDQCAAAGVPFLFKQWGNYRPCTDAELKQACGATLVGDRITGAYMMRVGKKKAGRLLDGIQHDGYPA